MAARPRVPTPAPAPPRTRDRILRSRPRVPLHGKSPPFSCSAPPPPPFLILHCVQMPIRGLAGDTGGGG